MQAELIHLKHVLLVIAFAMGYLQFVRMKRADGLFERMAREPHYVHLDQLKRDMELHRKRFRWMNNANSALVAIDITLYFL